MFPNSRLTGQANTLILPDLTSANIAYGMLKVLADGISVGPILLGLAAPAYVLHGSATTRGRAQYDRGRRRRGAKPGQGRADVATAADTAG